MFKKISTCLIGQFKYYGNRTLRENKNNFEIFFFPMLRLYQTILENVFYTK